MRLSRALNLTSMLVAFSGVLSLVLTLESALWLTMPAALLVMAGAASPEFLARAALPQKALTPLVIAAFGFSVLDFFFIGGSLVAAAADLMLIILCLKALTLREHKDYIQLYAASFFVLLASTGLSTEIYFALPFVMFFVTLTWALMLLTVKTEARSASARPERFVFGRGFFGGTALMTLCSLAVTLAIFFTIPRVGIGFMSRAAGGLLRTSGFSDEVELGSMGEVKLDPSIVMRVRMTGAGERPAYPLYWRGRVFDSYDGRSWKDTVRKRRSRYRGRTGEIYLRGDGVPAGAVEQEIALEPLDTTTLFALAPAYMIHSDITTVAVGAAGEMFLPYPPGVRLHYTAYSTPGEGEYADGDEPSDVYLQLPEGSDTVASAAAAATSGETDAQAKAKAIVRYLGANQRYTLDPPRDASLSPIDDFLAGGKAGFCEHFATAMTLMLRSSGVHARLVSGFMGGEWNAYGGYHIVRERDAHTWVEAYIPGEGWRVFDPTPASASAAGGQASGLGAAGRLMDYLRYRWDRYIVYYNLRDQLRATGRLSDLYYGMRARLSDAVEAAKRGMPGGVDATRLSGARTYAAAAAALLALAGALFGLWRITSGRRRGRSAPSVRFYAEMLGRLEKKGYRKAPGSTPREFAKSLPAGAGRLNESASDVTEAYYAVRYGGLRLTREQEQKVEKALADMRGPK